MNPRILPGLKNVDDIVADIWEIDRAKLYIKTRKREVVEARMVAISYRYKTMGFTMAKSTEPYKLNHCIADHSVKTIANLIKTDKAFRTKYELFMERMKQLKYNQ